MKPAGLLIIVPLVLLFSGLRANPCDTLPGMKPRTLDSVTVIHKRKAVIQNARGAVLDISKIDDVKFLDLAQVLKEIPGIDVDEENRSILYMGKAVTVTKDGISVAGFGDMIRNALSNPALNFSKVTLNIYDLKTEGPSLSFIEAKHDEGLFGNASVTGGTNMSLANLSLSVSKRRHLFNLAPSFMKMYGPKSEVRQVTERGVTDINTLNQSGVRSGSYSLNLGESFEIAQGKVLNTSLSIRRSESSFEMTADREQWRNDTLFNHMQLGNMNTSPFGPHNQTITWNSSYTWRSVTRNGHPKRFDFSLELNKNRSLNEQSARPTVLKGAYLPGSNFTNRRNDKEQGVFAMVAYELQHKTAGNFEAVIKYFNRDLRNAQAYSFRQSLHGPDSIIMQAYDINYQYAALLSSWDRQFRNFSLRAVVKADYSMDRASDKAARERFSFFTIAPYISVFRETKNGSLRGELQYNRLRPQLYMLTNITRYGEEYGVSNVVSMGNPGLRPSEKWNANVIYRTEVSAITVNLTGSYAITKDDIQPYYYLSNGLMASTYKNLASSQNIDLGFSAARYLFPRFQANISSGVKLGTFKIADTARTQNRAFWRENLTLSYTLSPKLRVTGGVSYDGGYSFQLNIPPRVQSHFSFTCVHEKLTGTVGIHNYHRPVMAIEKTVEADGYVMFSESRSRIFRATLMVAYRFGKMGKKEQKGKEIGKDDM